MADIVRESLERLRTMISGKFHLPDGKLRPDLPLAPRQLPWDRLLFLIDGEKYEPMSIDGKLCEVHLQPGDAWLVRRGIWEYTAVTTKHRFISLVFRGTYLRAVCYTFPEGLKPGDWHDPDIIHTGRTVPEPLTAVIRALSCSGGEHGSHIPFLLRSAVELTLQEIDRTGGPGGKSVETYEKILRYITHHYAEPIDRKFVADQFGMNGSYISQLLKEKFGMSFREYLFDLRISAAKRLLVTTELGMKEIASKCGFSGEVYFICRFREATGLPPGKFRAEQRKGGR